MRAWDLCEEPAPGDTYVGAVLALDPDEGANGTVRYWSRARGSARRLLRVHASTGRLFAAPQLPLVPGAAYDMAVSTQEIKCCTHSQSAEIIKWFQRSSTSSLCLREHLYTNATCCDAI